MATYEGWSNHETWAVNLWLSNDEYTNDQLEAAGSAAEIKELVHDLIFDEEIGQVRYIASLAGDLLTSALDRVDWREIYESIERPEEEEEEDEEEEG